MAILHSEHSLMITTPEGEKEMVYQRWQPISQQPKRVVICVHGLTRNSRDFDFLARELAMDALVICPDVLGRGGSDYMKDPSHYGYPLYLQQMTQLLAFIQQEYAPQQCDWVGTSMGGLIGMMLCATPADQLPLTIDRLVLNDVGYFIPRKALLRIAIYVGISKTFHSLTEAELYLRDIAKPFGLLTDEQWQHLAKHGTQALGDQLTLRYDTGIAAAFNELNGDVDLSPIWSQIQQTVLLLRGKDSDLLLPETASEMAGQSNVTLVEFEGVGHAPMFMDTEQINTVKQFIK